MIFLLSPLCLGSLAGIILYPLCIGMTIIHEVGTWLWRQNHTWVWAKWKGWKLDIGRQHVHSHNRVSVEVLNCPAGLAPQLFWSKGGWVGSWFMFIFRKPWYKATMFCAGDTHAGLKDLLISCMFSLHVAVSMVSETLEMPSLQFKVGLVSPIWL